MQVLYHSESWQPSADGKAAYVGCIFSLELQEQADCTAQKTAYKTENGAFGAYRLPFIFF